MKHDPFADFDKRADAHMQKFWKQAAVLGVIGLVATLGFVAACAWILKAIFS